MMNCNRCDYRGDELSEHALESGHLLCIVCGRRSLSERELMTCPTCVARVRADLADILDGYALLEPTSVDALTLLGDGTMQRLPRREELAGGVHDEWSNDPLPVLPALVSWEDFIREHYGDPKGPADPSLSQVIDYLISNLDTGRVVAQTFPAFDEFAAEIRRHRAVLRRTAGLEDDPVEATARCFDCTGRLLRRYGAGGLADEWTCADCRRVWTFHEYFFKLRVQQVDAPGEWRPLTVAAWLVDRPFRTVQQWMRDLAVRSACMTETKRQVVWMPDVKKLSDASGRRESRRSA